MGLCLLVCFVCAVTFVQLRMEADAFFYAQGIDWDLPTETIMEYINLMYSLHGVERQRQRP